MSELTKENAYRRWKKGEDPHKLAKEMGTTRERMRHILKKMDASVPLVDRIEELEAKLSKAVEALDEAIYLLDPDEEDIAKETGLHRIVTIFAELKGEK